MSKDLIKYVRYNYGNSIAEETRHLFNQLQVRIPIVDEFYKTRDTGALVFLNDAACCIRITNDIEHPNICHDRILQPLWTKTLSSQEIRIDIFPGVPQSVDGNLKQREERETLEETLDKDGIHWWDDTFYNMAYVTLDNVRHYLVIDTGSVTYFSDEVKVIRQKLAAQSIKPSVQKMAFGDLYESFEKAFPAGQKTANAQLMSDSWQLCRKFAGRSVLVPTWKSINYCGTTFYAAQYNARPWQLIP